MSIEAEGKCPVCGEPVSFYIDDPDTEGETTICDGAGCGATLRISFPIQVQIEDVTVKSYSMKFTCPRCHRPDLLEIAEAESYFEEEKECEKCDATLSFSWANWGYKAGDVTVHATVEIAFGCPCEGCYNSVSLTIEEEAGECETDCDSCAHRLSVEWSQWGDDVEASDLGPSVY